MPKKSSAADKALRATLERDALREEANALADARPRDNRGGRLTKWEKAADALGRKLDRAERNAREANKRARISERPREEVQRKRKRRGGEGGGGGGGGEGAPEWEIGVNYESGRRTSNVMVNVRIRTRDGSDLSREDAAAIMKQIHEGASPSRLPRNVEVKWVNWERPRWGGSARYGDARALKDFREVLGAVRLNEFKLKIPDDITRKH